MHVLRSVATHNDKFSTKSVSEIMVRNFSKVKEVFVDNILNNENLLFSQFSVPKLMSLIVNPGLVS